MVTYLRNNRAENWTRNRKSSVQPPKHYTTEPPRARLTKSPKIGPMTDISPSQVWNNFGPKFDLSQI